MNSIIKTYEDMKRFSIENKHYVPTPKEYHKFKTVESHFNLGRLNKSSFVIKKGSSIILTNERDKISKQHKKSIGVITEQDESFNAECFGRIGMCPCCPELTVSFETEVLPNITISTDPNNIEIVDR